MRREFGSNSIWYIILGLVSIATVVITAKRSGNWKQTLAFYFSIVGITFFIEWPILVIFEGYSYYPMIMQKSFDDSMMGNVFSQTLLSSSAIVIAINDLSFIWSIVFSLAYTLIEFLFIRLGMYEHYWYRLWYTSIGLLVYFWIAKKWYKIIILSPTPIIQHTALFLSVFAVYSPCIEWTLRILGVYLFKVNVILDPIRNHIFEYVIYIFFILNIIIAIYRTKLGFIFKVFMSAVIFLINFILVEFNILYIKTNWFLIYSIITTLSNYLLILLFDRMFGFKNRNALKIK